MRLDRRLALRLALAPCAAFFVTQCWALSATELLEYRIKAAFLCKFPSYVDWPGQAFTGADGSLIIGVMAADAVAEELARTAAGVTANGRPLLVRRLWRGDSLAGVHLVYVARSHGELLAETLSSARGKPVVTVTESESALAHGSMINFVVVDNKVRFDIAPSTAEASSLKISARLLSVARALVSKAS